MPSDYWVCATLGHEGVAAHMPDGRPFGFSTGTSGRIPFPVFRDWGATSTLRMYYPGAVCWDLLFLAIVLTAAGAM